MLAIFNFFSPTEMLAKKRQVLRDILICDI